MQQADVTLYLGGQPYSVQGERDDLPYARCFTPVHPPARGLPLHPVCAMLDSGAFSDPLQRRLTSAAALERQLCWERAAGAHWGVPWRAQALVSYDCLVDEWWEGARRTKRRWSAPQARWAVEQTVAAAEYLAGQRAALAPRELVLAVQGVTQEQYLGCARRVLAASAPQDVVGLSGWCVLGRFQSYLSGFYATMERVLPLVAAAGLRRVHIFGVLLLRALGVLLWLADRCALAVSTDSSAPLLACTWPNARKAGVRAAGWRQNVAWWRATLAGLRSSRWYGPPPARQLALEVEWDGGAHTQARDG